MPGLHTISPMQRYFYRLWAKTGFDPVRRNDSLRAAGYAEPQIKARGAEIAKSVNFLIVKEMARSMPVPYLVGKNKELLECMSPAHPLMPDNAQRNAALKTAYELMGAFPNPKLEIEKRELVVHLSMGTLKDAEIITGEDIVGLLPEDAFIETDLDDVIDVEPEPDEDQADQV